MGREGLTPLARFFVCWFGPRGLNSLLLALLAVQANIPGAEFLLTTVGVVVIASVAIHGASAPPIGAWYERKAASATLAEEREGTAGALFSRDDGEAPRITPAELHSLLSGSTPPTILDVRSRSSYELDGTQIPGSIRVLPDQVTEWAVSNRPEGLVITYCT